MEAATAAAAATGEAAKATAEVAKAAAEAAKATAEVAKATTEAVKATAEAASTAATSTATAASSKPDLVLDFLPEKPAPLDDAAASLLTEPTLQSLGLASWWPSGRVQYCMEWMHLGLDIPWWGAILASEFSLKFNEV